MFAPAFHPSFPQIVKHAGPVMANPKFVPVVSNDDPMRADLENLMSKIPGSSYWRAITAEYGVLSTTTVPAVRLTVTPPAKMKVDIVPTGGWHLEMPAIATWLREQPAVPPPDDNTVYVVFFTERTAIDIASLKMCDVAGGVHADAKFGNRQVPIVVVPRCVGKSTLEFVTVGAVHEMAEAATDPFSTNPAYTDFDDGHAGWNFFTGPEIGDFCAATTRAFKSDELGYTVQRSWSNASSLAGHHPCVPVPPGEPYLNAAPAAIDDIVTVKHLDSTIKAKGVRVPVGQTKTIEVDLFSDAAMGAPWSIIATVGNSAATTVSDPSTSSGPPVEVTLDREQGNNGDKLKLTLKANHALPEGFTTIQLVSKDHLEGATTMGFWGIVVGN
ncbi:MAG: hypothetical protein NVSMB1_02340 [Polyangiales bacterium]